MEIIMKKMFLFAFFAAIVSVNLGFSANTNDVCAKKKKSSVTSEECRHKRPTPTEG